MERWLKSSSLKRKVSDATSKNDVEETVVPDKLLCVPPEKQVACTSSCGESKTQNKLKRKYDNNYLKLGFFWTGDIEEPNPQCVLCYQVLSNDAMKPSKLKRHFQSRHEQFTKKPLEFFKRKCSELNASKRNMQQKVGGSENKNATEASYRVALLIAKIGKNYTIGETLIKPATKLITRIMLGDKEMHTVEKVQLSNDTVHRRIIAMAENVEKQLVLRLRESPHLALQVDESTDIVGAAKLLVYGRYEYYAEIHDDLLFCQSLPLNTTGECISKVINDYIINN